MGLPVNNTNRMAKSVDPDQTARYDLSHLDVCLLQRNLFWSAGLKRVKSRQVKAPFSNNTCLMQSEKVIVENIVLCFT